MTYTIKVRTAHPKTGKPCTYRLGSQGTLTTRCIYANMYDDETKAKLIATEINLKNADCVAWVEKF